MKFWYFVPVLWGLYNLILEKGSKHLSVPWLMLATGLATSCLAGYLIVEGKQRFNPDGSWWLLAALLIFPVATWMGMTGIAEVGAVKLSSWEVSYPFFAALFAFLIFGTVPNAQVVMGAAMVVVGGIVIIRNM